MTPQQFCDALERIGMSQRRLAHLVGMSQTTANKWALGYEPVPPAIATWLEAMVAHMRDAPKPPRRRVREAAWT